jgi:transposase
VVRARTILLLAAAMTVSAVAREVGRGRRIVRKWGERFQKKRLRGLEGLDGRGPKARFSPRSSDASGEADIARFTVEHGFGGALLREVVRELEAR